MTVGILQLAFPASSAPVTSTATSKLTVYQGVITVAPGVVGDNILELGNAGRDLAGTGDIFVRPGGVSGVSDNFAQFSLAAGRTYLRVPGTVTAGYLTVSASDTSSEGGEIALARSSGLYQDWFLDVFQSSFRLHSAGVAHLIMNPSSTTFQSANIDNGFHGTILRDASGERIRTGYSNFALDNAAHSTQVSDQFIWGPGSGTGDLFGSLGIGSRGNVASGITLFTSPGAGLQPRLRVANNGDVYVVSGSLCFGNAPGNCSNTWAGAGTPTLDSVLTAGRTSSNSASLGTTTLPTAKLLVHNAQSGAIAAPNTGSAGDAIAVYANSANSAIFARQDNAGAYAGYFGGRVSVTSLCFNGTNCRGGWTNPTLNDVLTAGNTSAVNMGLGTTLVSPLSKLVVNVGSALGTGNANYGISSYAVAGTRAIYAENTDTGFSSYAGYFNGDTRIQASSAGYTSILEVTPYGFIQDCPSFGGGVPGEANSPAIHMGSGTPTAYNIRLCLRKQNSLTSGAVTQDWNTALRNCARWGMRLPTISEALQLARRLCSPSNTGQTATSDEAMWTNVPSGGSAYMVGNPAASWSCTPGGAPVTLTAQGTGAYIKCVY